MVNLLKIIYLDKNQIVTLDPDLMDLGDIKNNTIQTIKKGSRNFNAKERSTITNIGTDSDYESYDNIKNDKLQDSNLFKKADKFLIFGFTYEPRPCRFLGCV